jgi:hypothetical protein
MAINRSSIGQQITKPGRKRKKKLSLNKKLRGGKTIGLNKKTSTKVKGNRLY